MIFTNYQTIVKTTMFIIKMVVSMPVVVSFHLFNKQINQLFFISVVVYNVSTEVIVKWLGNITSGAGSVSR